MRNIRKYVPYIYETLTKWLWPEVCPFCGKASAQGICAECRRKLDTLKVREPRCMRCGKPIRYAQQEYCHDCRNTVHSYDRGLSLWLHREPVKHSVYLFKYDNQRRFGIHYARELAQCYTPVIRKWNPDLLIPIPLHRHRRKKRGYNQAEIVACELGRLLEIPVDKRHLIRNRDTSPQKALGRGERARNLKCAFTLRKEFVPMARVLLIDDIYTTGNTMDAAAKVLKDGGVEKVYFLTISVGQGN